MRRYLWILAGLLAALAGVVVLAFVRTPTLGLDLQGGLELVLQAQAPKGREITDEDLDRSVEIIRSRVDKLGVSEPEIRRQGTDQISVALAGVFNPARAAEIVGKTAQLQFYDLEADLVQGTSIDANGIPIASPRLRPLLTREDRLDEGVEPTQWYLFSEENELLAGPADRKEDLVNALESGEVPEGATYYAAPEGQIVLSCGPPTVICPGGQGIAEPTQNYYYLFRYQPTAAEPIPEMTGEDLQLTGTRQDFFQGQPIVTLQFTDRGGDRFHDITRGLAQRGQLRGIPQHFAIVLDNEIRSWPQIDYRRLPDGISGNSAQIEGLASVDEAKDLALVLQTGALPVKFVQVERSDISATLGAESLRQALIAGIGGLIAVAIFLLVVYRFLGLVAIAGLLIYGALLYGGILLFNVTMTLAGFAGLILTIGVAADANIVIFERIKEEVMAGKSVRAAIGGGYTKGFRTIIDANVVTMITALILFLAATGGVRGFALMLLIGTLVSMVTAVAATRALLGLLAGFRWFDNPSFMGASAQKIPRWQRVDFVGRRNVWFALSATVLLVGLGSLGFRGLNLGIDFEGGVQVTFETPEPMAIADVRAEAQNLGVTSPVVQGTGDEVAGGYTDFRIQTESLPGEEQTAFQRGLQTEFGATAIGVKNVSASFSDQILRRALLAIVFSLILIVAYVAIRFRGWRFAVPVLVALVHDILITVGVYSLSGREVTVATVAAVLTILGYSIYDTIIIFDRVRENITLMRRSSFAAIANQSLWETVRRSLATTFSTLLPVSALFVFGGETLKDFAFALLVGIGSGAYSTIFIATPVLAMLKQREPEYAKRMEAGLREKLAHGEAAPPPEPAEAPEPVTAPAAADGGDGEVQPAPAAGDGAAAAARRAERRRRRRTRPHGRAR